MPSKTLLNSVNEVLKRVGIIAGDAGALTSLTDSARQRPIDVAVQVINEAIDELYNATSLSRPQGQAESTLVLVSGQRSYTLATDLVRLRYPMIDRDNTQYIGQYGGGYNQILVNDPEQDDPGLPHYGAINPVNGELHLDRIPDPEYDGRTYYYQYDKDLVLDEATDIVPFNDFVFRAMVPAWAEYWKRDIRREYDRGVFERNISRAAGGLSQTVPSTDWSPRRARTNYSAGTATPFRR